jgi:tRNA modification GTPase
MIPDPQDTIVALSSARGAGGRALIRLSGPAALQVALSSFAPVAPILPRQRRWYAGHISFAVRQAQGLQPLGLTATDARLPASLCYWPSPRSYTGQDIVELHMISSPPLVDLLISQLLASGARAAQPGEFTLRAFLAGKLDLTRAEAIRGIIEASSRAELKQALAQMAGGIAHPLERLREDLLNLLADIEAGLDFTEEDIRFVGTGELVNRLASGLDQLEALQQQLEGREVAHGPFRAVLVGRPNAGKSSLFNAVAPGAAALVSPEPGTTRDYLVRRLELENGAIELVDTPGWQDPAGHIEAKARALADEEMRRADLLLICVEAGRSPTEAEQAIMRDDRPVFPIATKCDLAAPEVGWLATSAVTRQGVDQLRAELSEELRDLRLPALAPSLSRCRFHIEACRDYLQECIDIAHRADAMELLALELRGALDQLGEMVGATYTENLLDRIFSRFCIGK